MGQIELSDGIFRILCGENVDLSLGEYVENPARYADKTCLCREQELIFTRDGQTLLTQTGWSLRRKDITLNVIGGETAVISFQNTVDGERAVVENAGTIKIGEAFEGEVRFRIEADEAIYGLGQGEGGRINHRDETEYLYQNNMKIPMPVFLSSKKYAVFFDAGCLMTYRQEGDEIVVSFDAAERIDYYVLAADSFDGLIAGLHNLTGRTAMLPRCAFGYLQSRERYKTQEEILETAARFKRENIPISCIILDWLSWEDGKWGNKRVDKGRFPDLKGMVDRLHERDIAFMISIWPNINRLGEDNAELLEAGGLLSNLSTYDAFNEDARALFWKQLERELYPAGTDAWWCDSTEPFTPDWQGEEKLPDAARYDLAKEELTKYLDARHANSYALRHAQGIFGHQTARSGEKRVVNLTRSGSPSIQKYGVVLWSGDIKATWDDFRKQVVEGLQMAMSGIPFWTLDIGAFFVGSAECWRRWSGRGDETPPWFWRGDFEKGVSDLGYRELYTRWLQLGTFLPVMRSHGTDTPREPWQFGEPGTKYYDTIVDYIRLRYRMLPYIYSLAANACFCGAPLMRHLIFDFHDDPRVREIGDQYMFGSAFLVCPVLEPMEFGPNGVKLDRPQTRDLYLPQGGWYDFYTGGYLAGGRRIMADAPINRIPLYVRAGAVLPLGDAAEGALTDIHVYEGADGAFALYIDKGDGYGYQAGEYAKISFHWDDVTGRLSIGGKEGQYAAPAEFFVKLHRRDGAVEEKAVPYTGASVAIDFGGG